MTMVKNIISEDETSYILKEKLEARLHVIFGYPIKVQVIHLPPTLPPSVATLSLTVDPVKHINGRYYFEAPRMVTPVSLDRDDLVSDLLIRGTLSLAQDEIA